MDLFKMFRKEPTPAPATVTRVHVVEPKPPTLNVGRATANEFRQGMWVMLGTSVGILKDMNAFGVCTVMLVDSMGLNELEIPVPLGELRRATQREIPAARVSHLTSADLARMGYEE